MNIACNLERAKRYFPDKPAVIFEDDAYSYQQLDGQANRVAGSLHKMGVEKGDRIAIFLPNIPQFVITYFAAQKLGAIAVSVNVMLKQDEVSYILSDSGARLVFVNQEQREFVSLDAAPTLEHVVIVEGTAAQGDMAFTEFLGQGTQDLRAIEMAPDDPAVILYTSGTTGFPKGAVLTHGNIVSNSLTASNHSKVTPEDRLQLFLPLFHCFGQNYILNGAFSKCATVVLHRRFEPEPVLKAISAHRVTMLFAVPTIYTLFLSMDTGGYDLSSLRYCFTAAANMPMEIAEKWKAAFGLAVHEGYGLTECSPFASYNHDFDCKLGSIGTPVENVEMKVVNQSGESLPPGEMGEIIIRGPNIMKEYWGNPEATAETIQDGWLHSGDVGFMDPDGYFFIADRVKDMINAAGFNVYPNEVEQILYRHPAVLEAAVYGVPDEIKGEVVCAAVVLREKAAVTDEALIAFCRDSMAVYKVPRTINFVSQLPKSATGKILKRVLRGDGG